MKLLEKYEEVKGLIADAVGDVTDNNYGHIRYLIKYGRRKELNKMVKSILDEYIRLVNNIDNPERYMIDKYYIDTYIRMYLGEM